MLREENELLTRTGPGTAAGEMLRRYWWPVAIADQVTPGAPPQRVRLLSEDLVLFRDRQGELGLLGLHCSHRGTSLEYGRVEEAGIRCPYHGWLYNRSGRCLDQPAEPADNTYKDRIQHLAYRAEELGGLIFAYIGQAPAPLLPRYDLLVRTDGAKLVGRASEPGNFNWLQNAENTVDQAHLPFLHASVYPSMAMKRPECSWERTWYGIRATTRIPGISTPKISINIFPSFNRFTAARVGTSPSHNMFFRVPVDDEHSDTLWVLFYPGVEQSSLTERDLRPQKQRRVPHVYERVDDGWWGIPSSEQDRMAVETQGPVANRASEHLASSDRGVVMLREMVKDAIEAVREGRDPVGVIRDVEENEYLEFDDQMEEIGVLV